MAAVPALKGDAPAVARKRRVRGAQARHQVPRFSRGHLHQIQSRRVCRLGGVYNIAVVVDDFIERLLVNDTLNANPDIKAARDRVPAPGLKFHITALVCQVTGGPCKYTGREWDAMVAEFRKT